MIENHTRLVLGSKASALKTRWLHATAYKWMEDYAKKHGLMRHKVYEIVLKRGIEYAETHDMAVESYLNDKLWYDQLGLEPQNILRPRVVVIRKDAVGHESMLKSVESVMQQYVWPRSHVLAVLYRAGIAVMEGDYNTKDGESDEK